MLICLPMSSNTISENFSFLNQGVLPTDYLSKYSTSKDHENMLAVRSCVKRGYMTNDKAGKYKYISGKRPLSYKLTDQAMQAIEAEKLAMKSLFLRGVIWRTDVFNGRHNQNMPTLTYSSAHFMKVEWAIFSLNTG